jgi:hypothetical protein
VAEASTADAPLAIVPRAAIALVAVVVYLSARTVLDPAPLAAARFGLGILLFALLVDLGRSIAGTGRPIRGALAPHQQRARPQVDEDYEDLRSAMQAYVEEGRLAPLLLDHVHRAAQARGLGDAASQRLAEQLRAAAGARAPTRALLGVRLLAGIVVTLGLGLAVASLAQGLGIAIVPPILLVTGTSITMLQWRAHDAGAPKTGLALGLVGVGLFGLGALRFFTASPLTGGLLAVLALAGLVATLHTTIRNEATDPPWGVVEHQLSGTLAKLRRAFLLALGAGVVVFTLDPLLAGFLSLPGALDVTLEVATVAIATVLAFLAIEGTGTALTLVVGRRRAEGDRQARREAVDRVLAHLEDPQEAPL